MSLHTISFIVTAFGYSCWGFLFLTMPLAGGGLFVLGFLVIFCSPLTAAAWCLGLGSARLQWLSERLHHWGSKLFGYALRFQSWMRSSVHAGAMAVVLLAFVPLLLGGMFLGSLVVAGQASKEGPMQVLT